MRRSTNKKIIEATERITFDEDITGLIGSMPSAFRITTSGAYHLVKWCTNFAYFDAMVIDTPIFDKSTMEALQINLSSFEIKVRLERATMFRDYLMSKWEDAHLNAPYYDWPSLLASGRASFDSVARAVARGKG